jgi:hypothetical protein
MTGRNATEIIVGLAAFCGRLRNVVAMYLILALVYLLAPGSAVR